MKTDFYFLSPVEVVKVNSNNLQEVAEWCGGTVAETESNKVPGRMDKYVWVPTPKGSSLSWAFPGMYITKRLVLTMKGELRATWAIFRRDYFEKNYFPSPNEAVEATWDKEDRSKQQKKEQPKPSEPKKKPAEYMSAQERDIKIHVGQAAQPGEPVQEPKPTTAEIEALTEEEREQLEQVNLSVIKKSPAEQREQLHEDAVEEISRVQVPKPEIAVENIRAEDPPLLQSSPHTEPVESESVETVVMEEAVELVKTELGGVEIEEKPVGTDTEPAIFEHVHIFEEKCGDRECGNFRYEDGIHIFDDQIIEATPEGWRVQGSNDEFTKPERVDYRSAVDGTYVTEEFAEKNPDTTVAETRELDDDGTPVITG